MIRAGTQPPLDDPEEALTHLRNATEKAGYGDRCVYGLDCAATHLYDPDGGTFAVAGRDLTRLELMDYYEKLAREHGVVTIEDPLHEEDFEGTAELTECLGIQVVGDDLFVTNADRVEKGATLGAANALLWQFNQIGTLSEAFDTANAAVRHGMSVIVSARSGETEDAIIAAWRLASAPGRSRLAHRCEANSHPSTTGS